MTESLIAGTVLTLPAVVDVRAAEPLKAELMAVRGQSVTIDASGVDRLGGLGLQVLMSAVRTWRADGQVLTFINVSDALAEQWQGFGASLNDLEAQGIAA